MDPKDVPESMDEYLNGIDRLRAAGWAASFAYEAYMREPLNDALGDDLDRQMDRLRKALENFRGLGES